MSGESRGWREQQHMIVARGEDRGDGDEGVATGAVLDNDRLTPFCRKLVAQQARGDIDSRTWTKRDNESDRSLRPGLRRLCVRVWCHENCCREKKAKGEQQLRQTLHDGSGFCPQ
jgi:hypothetical protein